MGDKIPATTAHLLKRARRLARKLEAIAPRQTHERIDVEPVLLRAVANVLWQIAGRLEDTDGEAVRDVLRATVRGFEAGERHAKR